MVTCYFRPTISCFRFFSSFVFANFVSMCSVNVSISIRLQHASVNSPILQWKLHFAIKLFCKLFLFLFIILLQQWTPVPPNVFQGWADQREASLAPPLPTCVSLPPSYFCCSCIHRNRWEARTQGVRRADVGAMRGAEAGPEWWNVRLMSVRNTSKQERNIWTARTGSWPQWWRAGQQTFNTCC